MKVAFFLGRIHHAIKLLPIAVELNRREHEVGFLIADNSINIDPTTEYLMHYGIHEFFHAKDFLTSKEIKKAHLDTSKAAISGMYEFLPHNSPSWLVSSMWEAARDLYGFNNFLDEYKPNAVFGLHENNFWVKILFYLASRKSIKTYSLMEGIVLEREEEDMGKYSIGTDYTDALFSWSTYDKQFYKDEYKILPVGPAHLDEWINMQKLPQDNYNNILVDLKNKFNLSLNKPIIIFAPPRLDLYQGDPLHAMHELRNYCIKNNFEFMIKMHPFQSKISDPSLDGVPIFYENDAAPFLLISDVVVTQTSTVALEALCLRKQVVELDLDYHGIEQPLWKDGAVTLVDTDINIIGKLLSEPLDVSKFIGARLPLADGLATARICDNVEGSFWIK